MQINNLTDRYAVSAQIAPDDCETIREAGFVAVVCNRPDDEVGPDEDSDAIAAAARAAGLSFIYNPVVNGAMNAENITDQGAALADHDGPVFAYCRSGTRSAIVWALSQAGTVSTDELIAAGGRGGYDLAGLRAHLDAAAKG